MWRRTIVLLMLCGIACSHVRRTANTQCAGDASLLSGQVVDRAGRPKAHSRVLLFADEGDVGIPAQTDADGNFSFGCVGPADYHVNIGASSQAVHVGRHERVDLRLRVW